jgi:hypothetical protein
VQGHYLSVARRLPVAGRGHGRQLRRGLAASRRPILASRL